MMPLVPVDNDPFAVQPKLVPVDHDPFSPSYDQIHAGMMANAIPATANNPLAALIAYGANLEQTIPFLHEAGSGLAAAFGAGEGKNFGERYNNLEQAQQAIREAGLQTQPRIETPNFMPDITPTGIGETGAALALTPAMPAPSKVANGFWPAVRQGAKWGAGYGATYGAADGNAFEDAADSAGDRLGNAIKGSAIGAPLGGIGGGIGFSVTKNITDKTASTPEDIKLLSEKIENDSNVTTPQKMAAALRSAQGQPITLADVAGPNVKSLGEALAQEPGQGMANATEFFNQRNINQPTRINDIISSNIAPLDFLDQKSQTLKNLSSPEITQAYNEAHAAVPRINDPQINEILNRLNSTDVGRTAWKNASEAAALQGRTLGNIDAVGNMGSMSTYGLDLYKKELDSLINNQASQGNFDRMSPKGASILENKNKLLSRLDEINPAYAAARQKYGDQASLLNAMQMGEQDLWGKNWAKVVPQIDKMTQPEREAFNSGIARKVSTMMNTQAGDSTIAGASNPARNILNNGNVRERLQAAIGTGADVDGFINKITQQAQMQDTANQILQGSRTARAQATQEALTDASRSNVSKAKPFADYLANFTIDRPGSWLGVTPQKVDQFGQKLSADKRAALAEALQSRLFNPDYKSNMKTIYELNKYPALMKQSQKALADALLAGNSFATQGPMRLITAQENQ